MAGTQKVIAYERRAPQLGDGSVWQTELINLSIRQVLGRIIIFLFVITSGLPLKHNYGKL
jgi:hypothetical protein